MRKKYVFWKVDKFEKKNIVEFVIKHVGEN